MKNIAFYAGVTPETEIRTLAVGTDKTMRPSLLLHLIGPDCQCRLYFDDVPTARRFLAVLRDGIDDWERRGA